MSKLVSNVIYIAVAIPVEKELMDLVNKGYDFIVQDNIPVVVDGSVVGIVTNSEEVTDENECVVGLTFWTRYIETLNFVYDDFVFEVQIRDSEINVVAVVSHS